MKNLITLILSFLVLNNAFAQSDNDYQDQMQKFRDFRKKMLERIFKDFDDDDFMRDDDFFNDPFTQIDKVFKSSGMGSSNAFSSEWTEDAKGRSLIIKFASKDAPVDLNVKDGMVSISGRIIQKSEHGSSVSSFSNSFSVPQDVDADKVNIENLEEGGLKLFFPYRSGMQPKTDDKTRIKLQPINNRKKSLKVPGEISL